MNHVKKGVILALVVSMASILGLTGIAPAQAAWPEKPITMLIPFAAGGSTDASARALVPGMEKALGQQIVLINKTGGGGTVGLSVLAGSKPDGYTISVGVNASIVWVPILRKVPYKPLGSFTNIICYGTAPTATVVKADSPFKTWGDMVAYARKNPGKLKYSTTGARSIFNVGMEMAAKQEGLKWIHIPQKGTMPALTALLGGHIDFVSAGPKFADFVHSGQMRPLAMLTQERAADFPEVPTLIEQGVNFYNNVGMYSLFGPAGMDPAIVAKLEDAVVQAVETAAFKNMSEKFLFMALKIRSKDFTQMLDQNWESNVNSLTSLGIVKTVGTAPR